MMSDFSDQLRLMLRFIYTRRNRDVIIGAADEIERLTAAFKLAHEQARSNALEIKVRGNQLAAANKRIEEIEAERDTVKKRVKDLWTANLALAIAVTELEAVIAERDSLIARLDHHTENS